MKAFNYERATTPEGAAQAVAAHANAKFIAGGTNLLDLMKLQIEQPAHLVDVNRVGLDQITDTADVGLRIGAMVRNSDLAADPRVRQRYPVLSRALLSGASGQLRNMATTAGNLLQRTRCYYFYDTSKPCNKRSPGAGCSAVGGFNRLHAVVGASDQCIAVHPSDMAVAMRVLDAGVETISPTAARRVIPIADFHRLPGNTPHIETALQPGEFITSVTLPPAPAGVQVYRKVRDRASYAFATISVAVIVDAKGGLFRHTQLAFGGLAHQPWRVATAETGLVNAPVNAATVAAAGEAVLKGAKGQGHNDFKIPLVKRVLAQVLMQAAQPLPA